MLMFSCALSVKCSYLSVPYHVPMCRFYFLGDDDLLEILGRPSNPDVIQCHLNKLFAGIHNVSLNSIDPTSKDASRSSNEARKLTAMVSVDGEEVPFPSAVAVTPVVEEWLAGVCIGMRHALQVLLPEALQDGGYVGGTLEPGSSDWTVLPAQVLSLVQEISFTQVGHLRNVSTMKAYTYSFSQLLSIPW